MASEAKATVDPSADSAGSKLLAFPGAPSGVSESSDVTAGAGGADGGAGAAMTAGIPRIVIPNTAALARRCDEVSMQPPRSRAGASRTLALDGRRPVGNRRHVPNTPARLFRQPGNLRRN